MEMFDGVGKENRYLVFSDWNNITEYDADDVADLIRILIDDDIRIDDIFQITRL